MPDGSPSLVFREGVSLHGFNTLGVGGPARWFVEVSRTADVDLAHRWCADRGIPLFVLGGGSNLVVADDGFDGLVLFMRMMGVSATEDSDGTTVVAGAGEPWDLLVSSLVDRGLSGVECLSGIPGTVGGTPIQNVGAYGQEVATAIERVTVFDRERGAATELVARDCGFAYRMSRFKGRDAGRFIVCEVAFRLRPGAPTITYPDVVRQMHQQGLVTPALGDVRRAVLAIRRRKGMVLDEGDPDTRSVGSFFMNPVVPLATRDRLEATSGEVPPCFAVSGDRVKIPAAWLIERSGFHKGAAEGAVGLSSKHPLAIVNRGGAAAADVVRFAARVKRAVADWSGISLMPEPVFVGLDGNVDVEYLRKANS